ncbi:hypothetical protein C1645_795546 [Glomus cerebriforme]|uniref:Uncharacterized protein n=1 Tax=Glomus cerebriforme TaxID=658196 RepID=A0A397S1I6_9GLOM|nr:hypothetical protein C1645_795546 [Glomus cerebriforme]
MNANDNGKIYFLPFIPIIFVFALIIKRELILIYLIYGFLLALVKFHYEELFNLNDDDNR